MKKTKVPGKFILVTAAFSLLASTSLAVPFAAMAWQRNIYHTFVNGRTSSRVITGTRTINGYSRNTVYTGPRGKTASRNAQGQWDQTTKTWTKTVTDTGANGRTAGRTTQGQWDPTTKTWTKTVTTNGSGQ